MKSRLFLTALVAGVVVSGLAVPLAIRDANDGSSAGLQVDLDYAIYEGVANSTTNLNSWLGIRYAAPPIGDLRWQPPQPPAQNRTSVTQADQYGSQCPQSSDNYNNPGAGELLAAEVASEDCLFLDVYAPSNATNLPVLVWIHGGGYGMLNAHTWPVHNLVVANDNGFILVAIQYRLGAFGFLSSDEVFRFGTVNAGLHDQRFALEWVQRYIHLFGGSNTAVTISGESAGGGSVMLQAMANGGNEGEKLFSNVIAASPYLPQQYPYDGSIPSQSYYAFANAAGCFQGLPYGNSLTPFQTIFQCLVAADTATLILASANVSSQGLYGTWGFLPVTDGILIQERPSLQLEQKQVNGVRMLAGNNANEGTNFTPQNITTEAALITFLHQTFPLFTNDDVQKILDTYPSTSAPVNPDDPLFATLGYTGPTAINQSNVATGQQQRANNIYAETTFVCPSYWLVEAFTDSGREAYKYQYSILPSLHGSDITGYFGPPTLEQAPEFDMAFMRVWGNFVVKSNPSLAENQLPPNIDAGNPIARWPAWSDDARLQINMNETGGVLVNGVLEEPGLLSNYSLVDAYSWEGGRGARCEFWRSMGKTVPE